MAQRPWTVSLVGGETALGRDLRDAISAAFSGARLQLIGAQDEISGILTEHEGEPVVMTPLDSERLQASDVVFCAGSPESARKALTLLPGPPNRPLVIDATYGLEAEPAARLRAPMLEPDGYEVPEGVLNVIAHPAAIATALVLAGAEHAGPVRHAVVHILEPASERGQAGMNELQQQSTGLLSFKSLDKAVFDAQIAFNVLARYGEDAPEALQNVQARVDRHLASLLGSRNTGMPSLRLVQAPVFHGYSFSFWIDFEGRTDAAAVSAALASAVIEVRGADLDAPTSAEATGQPGVVAGLVEADRWCPTAVWVWAAADNYRLVVDNALGVARVFAPGARA
jgi:aspartate-semialdehyde dehydrogenase